MGDRHSLAGPPGEVFLARGLYDDGDPDERLLHWERRSAEFVIGGGCT